MHSSKRNDYRVVETTRRETGKPIWKITVGGDINVTTCNTLAEATALAKNLNLDPYYLERGQTRADRVKALDGISEEQRARIFQ
tara:strand:+ start:205 stop:456 length:252 start_codon:yes stop_codon:yes gene_type:complete